VFLALLSLAFGIAFSLLSLWHSMRLPDAPLLSSSEWLALLKGTGGKDEIRERLRVQLNKTGDLPRRLQEVAQRLFAKSERRFPFAFIMIGAAPLLGLLGTVSGMFATFFGMSTASATAPIDIISGGISEALITTQTGLIIGVPTYIVCAWLRSRHRELTSKFRQLESQLLQQSNS
ncbi:MAG: MotA/TolQ/ExbB proton channel family protein, partial [Verrucomicrobia bacterium]|nr:MotA/TolQ/ExbB proton channel family protein [Verrucomicrobiota bacterium]